MWGGWYHDQKIMAELEVIKEITQQAKSKNPADYPSAEVVLFIDESGYLNVPRHHYFNSAVNQIRCAMGNSGIPFDMCMVEDAETIINKYRCAIFTAPFPSYAGSKAIEACKKAGIPTLLSTEEKPFFSTAELRSFLISKGVHCYNDKGNVIYSDTGFVGVHTVEDGKVTLKLPRSFTVRPLLGTGFPQTETDTVTLELKKHDTVIFELL